VKKKEGSHPIKLVTINQIALCDKRPCQPQPRNSESIFECTIWNFAKLRIAMAATVLTNVLGPYYAFGVGAICGRVEMDGIISSDDIG